MTDNTADLQYWLDNSQDVTIPPGDYYVDAIKGLMVRSNTKLTINGNLHALPTAEDWSRVLYLQRVQNVQVVLNGQIIGERQEHLSTVGGGHGMGIQLENSTGVSATGPGMISQCWGDSIYVIGGGNISLSGFTAAYSRRNNMSIITVEGLIARSVTWAMAGGTAPQAGIDLEPDTPDQFIKDVDIGFCTFIGNAGCGVLFGFGGAPRSNFINVKVHDNVNKGNKPISGLDGPLAKALYASCRWMPIYDWWAVPRSADI